MNPVDAEIRQEAIDPRYSYAVSAPAGSGKTGLLTQRVLNLLARVEQPENILAMTFTRKAADEMHQRIFAALQQAANKDKPENDPHKLLTYELAQKVIARDKELHWQLLTAPHRLRIQTIDGFCQSLVNQLPIEAGINDALRPSEQCDHLYSLCVREFLSLFKHQDYQHHMAALLSHVDNNLNRLETLLVELLRKRNQWLSVVFKSADSEQAKQYLLDSLKRDAEARLQTLEKHLGIYLPELLPLAQYAAENRGEPELAALYESFNLVTTDLEQRLAVWKSLAELLLTQKSSVDSDTLRKTVNINNGFPSSQDKQSREKQNLEKMKGLLAEWSDNESILASLRDVKALPLLNAVDTIDFVDNLTRLLPRLVAQFKLLCREVGQCDFDEISQAAVAALGDELAPSDLALRLDYQIHHILVDEFQDTSHLQLQLLEKLTRDWQTNDGRTLFVVGDAMQSCYGFRDAKVGLFLRVRQQGIGAIQLKPLDLLVNFRSQKTIVDWVNQVFSQAFPSRDDIRRGAVQYRMAQANHNAEGNASVRLLGFDDEISQARQIAKIVAQQLQQSDTDTIAILARTRNHLPLILAALRDANIVWEAQAIDALQTQMAVMDLLSLTKALTDLTDRISWLALLRAPWCGLNMDDLFYLVNDIDDDGFARLSPQSIWQRLETATTLPLSKEGKEIILRLRSILDAAFAKSHRQPFRQWLQGIWLALGGSASVVNPNEIHSTSHFFDLVEQHCGAWGIEHWPTFELAIESLFADSAQASRVQVMTLHKSKGLEFDVVILPQLQKQPGSDNKSLLLWEDSLNEDGQDNFLVSPSPPYGQKNALYDYLWREQSLAREFETTRLFYVACTRAIKHLYLCACLPIDEKSKTQQRKKPAARSLLAKVWPYIGDNFEFESNSAISQQQTPATTIGDERPLQHILRLPSDRPALLFPEDPTLAPYRQPVHYSDDAKHDDAKPDQGTFTQRYQRYCGTVIHQALEHICIHSLEIDDIERMKPLWALRLKQLGMANSVVPKWLTQVEDAVRKTLSDPKGRWLLDSTHEESVCEWQLSGFESVIDRTNPREWIIDRSFIDQGVRWVIDYKSSIPEPGQSQEAFVNQESSRYQSQLQAYHRALISYKPSALDSRYPVKTALYFPRLALFHPIDPNLQ